MLLAVPAAAAAAAAVVVQLWRLWYQYGPCQGDAA